MSQVVLEDVRFDLEPCACRYSHSAEVQVRLQFLTCVFSTLGSPDHFSKTCTAAFGRGGGRSAPKVGVVC